MNENPYKDIDVRVIDQRIGMGIGGWQTAVKGTQITMGPVFNNLNELWDWQSNNLKWVK